MLAVGDILFARWGIGDKIVEFWRITKRTPKTVWLERLTEQEHSTATYKGEIQVWLVPGDSVRADAGTLRRKVRSGWAHDDDGVEYVCASDFRILRKWDGEPVCRVLNAY